jgi:hypothetical protein
MAYTVMDLEPTVRSPAPGSLSDRLVLVKCVACRAVGDASPTG